MSLPLHLRQLGRVEYEPTWRAMQEFTATRTAETADELWVVEHPPVYTLGQAGKPEHLLTDNGSFFSTGKHPVETLLPMYPLDKAGFAFGSYGWGRGGPEEVEQYLQAMKVELLRPVLKLPYKPSPAGLDECRAAGRLLARHALKVCPA